MARTRRRTPGGLVYHALNRAARKAALFTADDEYDDFLRVLAEAKQQIPMRILAYIVMPNHWHLLLWPFGDADLSRFMHWLTTTHSCRWNLARERCGEGAVYQSRFKSIPIQDDTHLLRVWRYVERNALRANLVPRAEEWRWSSLPYRGRVGPIEIDEGPIRLPKDWNDIVNQPQTEAELGAIRAATAREIPYGADEWKRLAGLPVSSGRRGRPRRALPPDESRDLPFP